MWRRIFRLFKADKETMLLVDKVLLCKHFILLQVSGDKFFEFTKGNLDAHKKFEVHRFFRRKYFKELK